MEDLQVRLPKIPEHGIGHFFDYYLKEHSMPEPVFVQFWKDLFLFLEQKHDYEFDPKFDGYPWIQIPGKEKINNLLCEVNRCHPGNHWIPDSGVAFKVIQGVVPLLHPAGEFLFTQLTTDLQSIHQDFESLRQMGVTIAAPILREIFERAGNAAGFEIKFISAGLFGASPTSGLFVVKKRY